MFKWAPHNSVFILEICCFTPLPQDMCRGLTYESVPGYTDEGNVYPTNSSGLKHLFDQSSSKESWEWLSRFANPPAPRMQFLTFFREALRESSSWIFGSICYTAPDLGKWSFSIHSCNTWPRSFLSFSFWTGNCLKGKEKKTRRLQGDYISYVKGVFKKAGRHHW